MPNTYAKLQNGDWGVRVAGPKPAEGDALTVTKKDGSSKKEVIGRVLWSGAGVYLCTIAPKSAAPSGSGTGGSARRRRPWRPCGYPGCQPGFCDECDGEGG